MHHDRDVDVYEKMIFEHNAMDSLVKAEAYLQGWTNGTKPLQKAENK